MSVGRLQSFSLQTKFLAFAAALVLLPGGIYGAIAISQSRTAIADVVGRQLSLEARSTADRLATALRSEKRRLESFATQDVMREIRIHDLDKRISSFLASVKSGCPACTDLLVLDGQDQVLASSNPERIGKSAGHGLGDDHAGAKIEGPLRSPFGSGDVLRFTLPVPDPEDPRARLGRLVALLDWQRETEVIARTRDNLVSVGLDADILIVDPRGVVIGSAEHEGALWRPGDTIDLSPLDRQDGSQDGHVDWKAGVLLGRERLADDLPRWSIVVAEPLAAALAPVDRTAKLLGGALAATLLATLAVAVAAVRRVTRPLAELTAAADQVGRGRRPAPTVAVRSRDEVGTLATAFNRMSVELKQAERELVEAAKFAFVGELAAGVAHEVRTPLGVMRSSAQLLERSLVTEDSEARELLQMLRKEVDRIENVICGLLELGRPHGPSPEDSPLGPIIFRAADFAGAQARQKGVSLSRRAVDPEPIAYCDPELVYQIALNLIVNAVQVVPEGGSVEIGLLPARDGYAGFEVRDDGPGMTADVRARIFEPFFSRRDGGFGLGLTFVQRVVQEHRGRISVESEPGHGTIFRVELPIAETFA